MNLNFERNYRYIKAPENLNSLGRLAFTLGRDAGFGRIGWVSSVRSQRPNYRGIFMDGYRAALMVS